MITQLRNVFDGLLYNLFHTKKKIRIGLYGPPNSGKTTLANNICTNLLGYETKLGEVSSIAHETRKIGIKEGLILKLGRKTINFDLVDTPGIASRINYEIFKRAGLTDRESKQRAKEATKGVIESIKWLDNMDLVLIILDSTKNPLNQVNLTIIGNLEARKIPTIVVANKTDLKSSKILKIESAFPKYAVIGVSAKFSYNLDGLYNAISKVKIKKAARKR